MFKGFNNWLMVVLGGEISLQKQVQERINKQIIQEIFLQMKNLSI